MITGDCGACIYNANEGDLAEFSAKSEVTARKDHRCCECGDVISKGTRYERTVGKWERKVQTFKTCLPCAEIRRAFCCEGWTYGLLWEDANEEFFEHMTTGCLEQLTTAAAKAKLLARWRDWKELDV